ERVLGLALAQGAIAMLAFFAAAPVSRIRGMAYRLPAAAALLLALTRTVKETWRSYALYMESGSSLVLFGVLAAAVAGWGLYWGWRAAFRMGRAILAAAGVMSVLVVLALLPHARAVHFTAEPLRAEPLAGAFGSLFFLMPETIFLAENTVEKGSTKENARRMAGYAALIWTVQSFWWALAQAVWGPGGAAGVLETARLGVLSVFRRFDVLYLPVLLMLFFARLVLYTLWLGQLLEGREKKRCRVWIVLAAALLGAAFLYGGGREDILYTGEQVLLWSVLTILAAERLWPKQKNG
ncbi:MAG: hypothetical protein IIV90_04715, partial [Oscillospiraceae bacterium]|nr:hypothetical protein [Oscillospiraceae bacterium]